MHFHLTLCLLLCERFLGLFALLSHICFLVTYLLFAGTECTLTKDDRVEVLAGPRGGSVADDAQEPMDTAEHSHIFLKQCLPRLPADCVRFSEQRVYSDLVKDMIAALPPNRQLNEDQNIFMVRFAEVLDTSSNKRTRDMSTTCFF